MLLLVVGGFICPVIAAVGMILWRRSRNKRLRERLRRTAGLLSNSARVELEPEDSIFRTIRSRSRLSRLVEARYPLIEPRRALVRMVLAAVGGGVAAWLSMWFLKISLGWWSIPLLCLVSLAGARYAVSSMHARKEVQFIRQFPEIVDQIVRLAGAGVPPLEAISIVAEDSQPPVEPALREVCDALNAGLDAETALELTARRIRLVEFTLFASIIRLQRRAGGGISTTFLNLSATLREDRAIALKARASTAQTRLSLLVLTLMPVVVLAAQKFISPESVHVLFNTEHGILMLRVGIALIVVGLLIARIISARLKQ